MSYPFFVQHEQISAVFKNSHESPLEDFVSAVQIIFDPLKQYESNEDFIFLGQDKPNKNALLCYRFRSKIYLQEAWF